MKSIVHYIFNPIEFFEDKKEEERLSKLDSLSFKYIEKLEKAREFKDLLQIHKEAVKDGFDFETVNSWNFNHMPIERVRIFDLAFNAYDRDTIIHGRDLEELENTDNDNDWLNWSYWTSWKWYYSTLYRRIICHRHPQDDVDIDVPTPTAVLDFFK